MFCNIARAFINVVMSLSIYHTLHCSGGTYFDEVMKYGISGSNKI
jgi:hypothetical protein